MSAAITDLLTQVGQPGTVTSMASPGKALGAASINVGSTANWPTGTAVFFAMRQVDPTQVSLTNPSGLVAGTYTEWKGIVASGTIINNLTLQFGTDQVYPAGSNTQVFVVVSAARENSIVTWGVAQHNQDGSHHDITTNAITATNGIFTNLTVAGGATAVGWTPVGQVPTYVGNNGNKEYIVSYPADMTAILAKGMRHQVTRSAAPASQCMLYVAANSQLASKSSPAGLTFTGNHTAEVWIYLNSYPSTTVSVGGRDAAAGSAAGFEFGITASGQISMFWRNASGTTAFNTFQSIPLKTWTHIAGSATVATPTVAFYMNGALVPGQATISVATSVVQASTNFALGKGNNTTSYLDAQIQEFRQWSVAQTQAAIQANMPLSLTTATNLVLNYPGAGNFNDLSGNGNNLTASGGAIATQTGNVFSLIEYGLITKVGAFTAGATQITIFTGTDYNIPNMTLSAAQYSAAHAPFGFPDAKEKWTVTTLYLTQFSQSSPAGSTWYNLGNFQLSIPSGSWDVAYLVNIQDTKASAGIDCYSTLSLTNSAQGDYDLGASGEVGAVPLSAALQARKALSLTAATIYFLNLMTTYTSVTQIVIWGASAVRPGSYVKAVSAYL